MKENYLSTNYLRYSEIKTIDLLEKTRKKIKEDPWLLSKILYPNYNFKEFHREWFYNSLNEEEDLCLAPRYFAKTTVRCVITSIWEMIENPNIQIGLVSDTNPQAIHFAAETKMHCEKNETLTTLYPYLKPGDKWGENEFTIIGATEIKKGATITAFGYGGATGYHFDKLKVDDIVDFENVRTKAQRDKLQAWVGMSLIPMLKPGGKLSWNGTRYHPDDYYGFLLHNGIKTNINSHKAILDNGESMWPEVWPINKLLDRKNKMGSIQFNAQIQNDVVLMARGQIFKREWFKYFRKEGEYYVTTEGKRIHIEDISFYQTCDLAKSKKDTADYFVILTFGIDKEGNIYLNNLLRGRFSWAEQKKLTAENYTRNAPLNWLAIESTQYQSVLIDEMNVFINISVRELNAIGDKVTRANSMSAKFETGKVWTWDKLPHLEEFEDELAGFPDGEHDDMVDTVGYIPQCIEKDRAPRVWALG